ncbi:hypothetical protein E3N88_00941 [Mikania micrantha]|uniref:Uncharacterized protein n=1 Tax=Mikania micrantha TaxID=192012 RepID=A0A5N6PZK5_9ASTR|nr:hypothetical protein E3N88_00941 [Mikania micrantha]
MASHEAEVTSSKAAEVTPEATENEEDEREQEEQEEERQPLGQTIPYKKHEPFKRRKTVARRKRHEEIPKSVYFFVAEWSYSSLEKKIVLKYCNGNIVKLQENNQRCLLTFKSTKKTFRC